MKQIQIPRAAWFKAAGLLLALAIAGIAPAAETKTPDDPYASIRNDIQAEIAAGRLTGVSVALVPLKNRAKPSPLTR